MTTSTLDARDEALVARRIELRDAVPTPRVGDALRFPDGELRRISYLWGDGAQTTWPKEGGSFYLGGSGCSYSGSLRPCVPLTSLTLTDETLELSAWVFHHDYMVAGGAVHVKIPCRVYECSVPAP